MSDSDLPGPGAPGWRLCSPRAVQVLVALAHGAHPHRRGHTRVDDLAAACGCTRHTVGAALTQDNRPSARCLANTGPRTYLVVEQDSGSANEQAAVLLHLAERAPMVLALTSGNKSLHGWLACRDASDDKLRAFFNYAVMLGADPALWTPCQLVRMPEGRRDTGARQAVLFLNWDAL